MTKRIGLTQRVTVIDSHQERRDSLDQRWWPFIKALGFIPVPLPNLLAAEARQLAEALDLSAIILTSGNSISAFDPKSPETAPERDAFEVALIDWALQADCPIVGVCRGLQLINYYFGGTLAPVTHHVATTHRIEFLGHWEKQKPRHVNSYHHWGIFKDNLAPALQPLAKHADGSIEALMHPHKKIAGIMWHPEREASLVAEDIELFKEFLLYPLQ